MRQTNNAIKFLIAQYRAIFNNANLAMAAKLAKSSAMAAKAAALAAVVTVSAAHAAAGDAALESGEWAKALVDGKGTISITGKDTDQGAEGKFQKLTLTGAAGDGQNLSLAKGQKLVIGDSAVDDNTIKTGTAGHKLSIAGEGDIEINGTNAGGQKYGLTVEAGSGDVTIAVNSLSVKSDLLIKTSAQNDKWAKVGAKKITIGDGEFTGGTQASGLAHVQVGDAKGEGYISFGAEDAEFLVDKDGKLSLTAISGTKPADAQDYPGARILGKSAVVKGVVTFESGAAGGKSFYNIDNTTFDGGVLAVKDGALVNVDLFTPNNKMLFSSGSHLVLGTNMELETGTLEISNDSVLAASADTGKLTLGAAAKTHDDQAVLKISGKQLASFLSGQVSDSEKLKYKDESLLFDGNGSNDLAEAANGAISLKKGGTIELSDAEAVELSDFSFAVNDTAGSISYADGARFKAKNLTVSKAVNGAGTLDVVTEKLTLGSDKFDSSKKALGVSIEAKQVKFVPSGSAAYTLLDTVKLRSPELSTIEGSVNVGKGSSGGLIDIFYSLYSMDKGNDIVIT